MAACVSGIIVGVGLFFGLVLQTMEVVIALHICLHCYHILLHEVVFGTFGLTLSTSVRWCMFDGICFFAAYAAYVHVEVAAFEPGLLHVGCEFVHYFVLDPCCLQCVHFQYRSFRCLLPDFFRSVLYACRLLESPLGECEQRLPNFDLLMLHTSLLRYTLDGMLLERQEMERLPCASFLC